MDPSKALADGLVAIALFYLFIILLGFSYFVLWLYSIYHCLTKGPEKDRVVWILVICLVPVFGVIFYLAIGRKKASPPILPRPKDVPAPPPALAAVDPHQAAVLNAASLSDERERAEAITRALREQSANRRRT